MDGVFMCPVNWNHGMDSTAMDFRAAPLSLLILFIRIPFHRVKLAVQLAAVPAFKQLRQKPVSATPDWCVHALCERLNDATLPATFDKQLLPITRFWLKTVLIVDQSESLLAPPSASLRWNLLRLPRSSCRRKRSCSTQR